MNASRRSVLAAAGLLLPLSTARAALPDRPVRLVLGFPAGSGPERGGRALADGLSAKRKSTTVYGAP